MEKYKTIYDELAELKKDNEQYRIENEIMRNLINNYYEKGKHDVNKYLADAKQKRELSDNAKRFVRDIIEGRI